MNTKQEIECVNKHIPNRTRKEYKKKYYNDNKDKIIEKSKKYYLYRREVRRLLDINV